SSTTSSPSGTTRLRSAIASTLPKRLVTRSTTISAMARLREEIAVQRASRNGVEHDQRLVLEFQSDAVADARRDGGGNARLDPPVIGVDGHDLHRAHVLGAEDLAAQAA